MGNRLFYCSLSSVLLLGGLQVTQPWQHFANESNPGLPPRPTSATQGDKRSESAPNLLTVDTMVTVDTIDLSQEVPDQGRPSGRLRGGGSR